MKVTRQEQEYGLIKAKFPIKDLLRVPHEGKPSTLSSAFGSNPYRANLESMSQTYLHPETQKEISFNPATTSQSISAATYGFGEGNEVDAKRDIFDPRWLQLGYIVRTQDGVFINTTIQYESQLKNLLDSASATEKINGIYLFKNGVAFAPYDSFKREVQDADTFAHGGLARALEHTREKVAENLRKIASLNHYKLGVNFWGFDDVQEPTLRVVSLDSGGDLGGNGLDVNGDSWDGDDGYAFGVPYEKNSSRNK